jgi:ABC-type Mn2+/Zn2+ transport system permease subunit
MELFDSELLRRALAEVVLLGVVCGPLGVWILHLRHTYAAESLTHAMLPGLVVAALIGAPLVLGAAGGIVLAALLIAFAARDRRIGSELAVAVTVGALFGLGAALALAPETPARLGELLFGDPLGATYGDLAVALGLGLVVLIALGAGGRSLRVTAFDPGSARSLGVSPGRTSAALLVLLGVAIVAAVQGLGNLLVLALLVAPAAAALRASDRLAVQLRLAALLGGLAGVGGMELSYVADVAAGPSVALVACAMAVAASLVPGRSGRARAPRGRGPIEGLTAGH